MEFSKNEERDVSEFHKYSGYSALWECPKCHGEYRHPIKDRYVGDDSCPYCSNRKALYGFNSLADADSDLALEWSSNNDRNPTEFLRTSAYNALWACPECHGEYNYPIKDRYVGDDSCPYCNNRRVLAGLNSLADKDSDLALEWSSNNDRKPTEFLRISAYNALWECPECHGEYNYPIRDRYVGDDSCPYCSNRKVLPGINSFKVKHLDLMNEWYYQNNYLLVNPDNILPTYNEEVWWKCSTCGERYKMSPKRRLYFKMRHMKSCSFCKGRRRKRHRHF